MDESSDSTIPPAAFIAPADVEFTISIETAIENPFVVNQEELLAAWEELANVSVEATIAERPSLYQFADNCLLFGAVRSPVPVPLTEHTAIDTLGLPAHNEIGVVWTGDVPIVPHDSFDLLTRIREGRRQLLQKSTGVSSPPSKSRPNFQANPTPISASSPSSAQRSKKDLAVFEMKTIGIVYVTQSSIPREVHVGVALLPPYRSRGAGLQTVAYAVQWAIETIQAHRVQARIMTSHSVAQQYASSAQRLFTALGFAHEGVQRRAVMDAAGEWADITHMGIIDTEWVIRRRLRAAPRNMWDELFERHQREREQLLRWEERQGSMLRRTSSMETLRMAIESEDDAEYLDAPSPYLDAPSPPLCPGTRSPSPSGSALPRRSQAHSEHDSPVDISWRSPQIDLSSDAEDPFLDTESTASFSDLSRFSEEPEPVERPLSAASWSSFDSLGSSSSGAGSLAGEWVRLATSRG